MIQEPLAVVAVLLGAIFFSLRMVHRYGWAERLSAIIWIIFTSALCSNLGLIPTDAPVLRPVRQLQGAWEIGDLTFYVFFAAVGALIDFYQAVALSPILFLYVVVIMAVHMVFLYGSGRWLRMDVGVLTIASVATKAGPAMVVPVAEAKGWRHLALPGIIVAMLGYAVGNYVGYAVAQAVRAVGGG